MRTKFYKIFGTFPLAWKFKLLLLTKNTTANTRGADLSNYTSDLPVENTYFNTYLPGQLWTVEQQCKVAMGFIGSSASACGVRLNKYLRNN